MTLKQIWQSLAANGYESDKGSVHSYLDIYEEILSKYRNCENVLEIGIFKGHSLRMWDMYFDGYVHGIDCSETPVGGMADLRPMIESGEYFIHIMDGTDADAVAREFGDMRFSVIIDDAAHDIQQQLDLYKVWKPYLAPGGIYIIEDVQDLDAHRDLFLNIDPDKTVTILDRRGIKGRYDDVLVIIK